MVHRVNVLLDNDAWATLQEIPRGDRSRMVSKAINHMADMAGKVKAAKKMDALRQKSPRVFSTAQITNWIREDRGR